MPQLIIFKANKIKPEWREAAPTGYMIRGSATGYINGRPFQEFGEHFVRFLTEKKILAGNNKVLLLLDMHKSHLFNLGFMEYMKSKNVEVCCFPPHCTHIQQTGEEPGEQDYPLEDDNGEDEEDQEEDEDEEDEEDLQDPDFNAMIEEGVKAGQLQVKVRINSSG